MSRENVLGQLREHGVPVVAWAGAGSLDQVLRDVARMAAAPKAIRR
jgi:ABC-type hemin transport system substrate-binding protein